MNRSSGLAAVLAASLISTALPAQAQSTFERLEAVAVQMNALMFEGLVAQIPALEGNMPTPEWSDDLRTAYTCMYDGFEDEVGAAAMTDMVAAMELELETATAMDILEGGGSVENPEGLTDERAAEIVGGCGMMEAFMGHMADSGALAIMMQENQ